MTEEFGNAIRRAVARDSSLDELVDVLKEHKELGMTRQEAYEVLQAVRPEFDESREDRILELMDIVSGFCAPSNRVWT